jgi:uncharacterized membrane protein
VTVLALILSIIALAAASKRSRPDEELHKRLDDIDIRLRYLEVKAEAGPLAARADAGERLFGAKRPSPWAPAETEVEPAAAIPALPVDRQPEPVMAEKTAVPPSGTEDRPMESTEDPQSQPNESWRSQVNFEELFGRRLPVWGGGIALALAGFFLVKYSIDSGLMTPAVRTGLGLLFGFTLVGGAEVARRFSRVTIDPRIQQALCGAGIMVLYGASYMASSLYGLVSGMTGFVMMASTTAAALALSLRYGAPTALLGLLGGFATPALAGTNEGSVPLLLGYLLLTIAGLLGIARQRGWRWLAALALAGGFGWSATLLAVTELSGFDVPGAGLFLIAVALGSVLALPATGSDDRDYRVELAVPLASAVMACVQLGVLVGKGGFGWIEWGFYALLSGGLTIVAIRDARYALMPLAAFAVAIVTFALWPRPPIVGGAVVAAGLIILFVLPACRLAVADRYWLPWLVSAAGGPTAVFAVAHVRIGEGLTDIVSAAAAFVLALPGALGARFAHRGIAHSGDVRFGAFLASAALQLYLAGYLALPPIWLPTYAALLMTGLGLAQTRTRRAITSELTAAAGGLTLVSLLFDASRFGDAVARVVGADASVDPFAGVVMFAIPAVLALVTARWQHGDTHRTVGVVVAAVLLGVAACQLVPPQLRPAAVALVGAAMVAADGRIPGLPLRLPGYGVCAAAVALGLETALRIAGEAAGTLVGIATSSQSLPGFEDGLLRLVLPAAIIGVVLWQTRLADRWARGLTLAAAALAGAAIYGFYKHAFGIDTGEDFIARGFAERTVLTQALFVCGAFAYRRERLQDLGRLLTLAALARLVWFDFVVFNPFWREQTVGELPVLNWLLPAYGLSLYWLLRAMREDRRLHPQLSLGLKAGGVGIVLLLVATTIRQAFVGSILAGGDIGDAESYCYSLAGLLVAVAMLFEGTRRVDHHIRIASLGIVLLTVGKVFLLDAAELDGLWRIGSFFGLGVSLIGISWYYTRHVFARRVVDGAEAI